MSKKRLKIYSNDEFKAASKIDRIYMWMIEPNRFDGLLLDREEKYARDLQQAYAAVYGELRRSAATKWIQANIPGRESIYLASKLLDDMQELYGRFLEKNKALKQAILVEKLYEQADRLDKLAIKFKEEEEHEAAAIYTEKSAAIYEKAGKLEGLDKVVTTFTMEDFVIPAIEISSDPKVLKKGEIEDAEVVE